MHNVFTARTHAWLNRPAAAAVLMAALGIAAAAGRTLAASDGGGGQLFIASAVEHPDGTATFPLYRGTSHGQNVYYLVLDTSDGNLSQALGVNRSQKLANARNTAAAQKVNVINGVVDFPATVDFSPTRLVTVENGEFPPTVFQPGAVGEPGYSPLIQLPNGTVVNAPQIARDANGDGSIDLLSEAADKVVSIDLVQRTVTYRETSGFQGDNPVRYVSTDSSLQLAATLEDVTYAPALDSAPAAGDDSTASSRATLVAFINGQTGAANPQRQGLTSAVRGEGDPLNVLRWNPGQGRYSPLWDVNLAVWSASTVASGRNLRQTDVGTVQGIANTGAITGPDGGRLGASGFIVNCPIVSLLPKP
ncbi:MAG TPA: hypothetical protein VKE51_07460 [Vicinamibacterales bacterium]|nr:hypothetical protein [Vicinamibacterales bacterium]